MVALDAKINFDDNALFRHPDIVAMRDLDEEDPAEVEASKFDLNYISARRRHRLPGERRRPRDGDHGHHQALRRQPGQLPRRGRRRHGGEGDRGVQDHAANPKLKAILVNIFGGIMKCDVIAAGVVAAARAGEASRCRWWCASKGTNVELGKKILADSGLPIISRTTWPTRRRKSCAIAAANRARKRSHEHPDQQEHQGHHSGHHRQDRAVPHAAWASSTPTASTATSPA